MCNGCTTIPNTYVFLDDLTLYLESSDQTRNSHPECRFKEPIHYQINEGGLCTQYTVLGITCTMFLQSLS